MIKLIIYDNSKNKIENILLNSFDKFNIIKEYQKEDNEYKYWLYDDDNLIIKSSYIQKIFKNLINILGKTPLEKINLLKDLFKDDESECFILGAGPTYAEVSNSYKRYIINNYFTFAIKYIINELDKNNLFPTMYLFNEYIADNQTLPKNYEKTLSAGTNLKKYNSDIKIFLNKSINHNNNFKLIIKEVDSISFEANSKYIKNNNIYLPFGHTMYELAIPLAIHMGFKKIYTIGWDLVQDSKYSYFNGVVKKNDKLKSALNQDPIKTTKHLSNMLYNKFNIKIYKTNLKSNPQINYKSLSYIIHDIKTDYVLFKNKDKIKVD